MKYLLLFLFFALFYCVSSFDGITSNEVANLPLELKKTASKNWRWDEFSWGIVRSLSHSTPTCAEACQNCGEEFEPYEPPTLDFKYNGFLKTYELVDGDLDHRKEVIKSGAPLLFKVARGYCFCQKKNVRLPYIDVKSTLLFELGQFLSRLRRIEATLKNIMHLSLNEQVVLSKGDIEEEKLEAFRKATSDYYLHVITPLIVWCRNRDLDGQEDHAIFLDLLSKILVLHSSEIPKTNFEFEVWEIDDKLLDIRILMNHDKLLSGAQFRVLAEYFSTNKQSEKLYQGKPLPLPPPQVENQDYYIDFRDIQYTGCNFPQGYELQQVHEIGQSHRTGQDTPAKSEVGSNAHSSGIPNRASLPVGMMGSVSVPEPISASTLLHSASFYLVSIIVCVTSFAMTGIFT